MRGTCHHPSSVLRRLTAVFGVALVLVLNVLAVRPELHEALCHHERTAAGCLPGGNAAVPHSHQQGESEETDSAAGCVATLFAQGHVLTALASLQLCAVEWRREARAFPPSALVPAASDCRWPLGRGPPRA